MHDVVIIGAGPAGLSAAIACREWDLSVLVLDEFPKPGGRLLGQLHQEPDGEWWNGIKEARKLLEDAEGRGADVRCGVSVHHVEKTESGFKVHTDHNIFKAENLLIATGAAESAAPIPGWTLPGVMSIGAAQVMTNVHRVRVGTKGIVAGINVLSAAIARELTLAGTELHSMALPAKNTVTKEQGDPVKVMNKLAGIAHMAPSRFLRLGGWLAQASWVRRLAVKFYPKGGMKVWGVPVQIRKAITKINGRDQVESVTICDVTPHGKPIPGSESIVDVDFVCIAGGLYPLTELAAVAGCPFRYVEELGGHVPIHNNRMETPIAGLYVAGNITGIESAKVAASQGRVAGLSIAKNKANDTKEIDRGISQAMQIVKSIRKQASIQFHPEIEQGRSRMENIFQEYDYR
jgi:sarcosine oxidase subunit alpha